MNIFFMENHVLEAGDFTANQDVVLQCSLQQIPCVEGIQYRTSVSLDKTVIKNSMVNASKIMSGEVDHNLYMLG